MKTKINITNEYLNSIEAIWFAEKKEDEKDEKKKNAWSHVIKKEAHIRLI